jgi:hypothetical protein
MSAVSIDAPHLTVGDLCNLAGVPNEAYKTASLDALREIASDLFTHDEQGDIPKTKSAIMKYIAAQVRLREELDSPMKRLDLFRSLFTGLPGVPQALVNQDDYDDQDVAMYDQPDDRDDADVDRRVEGGVPTTSPFESESDDELSPSPPVSAAKKTNKVAAPGKVNKSATKTAAPTPARLSPNTPHKDSHGPPRRDAAPSTGTQKSPATSSRPPSSASRPAVGKLRLEETLSAPVSATIPAQSRRQRATHSPMTPQEAMASLGLIIHRADSLVVAPHLSYLAAVAEEDEKAKSLVSYASREVYTEPAVSTQLFQSAAVLIYSDRVPHSFDEIRHFSEAQVTTFPGGNTPPNTMIDRTELSWKAFIETLFDPILTIHLVQPPCGIEDTLIFLHKMVLMAAKHSPCFAADYYTALRAHRRFAEPWSPVSSAAMSQVAGAIQNSKELSSAMVPRKQAPPTTGVESEKPKDGHAKPMG